MAGMQQSTPWAFAPYGTLGSFASVPGNFSAVPNAGILQQLQIVPQQLQQVHQAAYVQQQQLQQILQVLQYVPQQVQQVLQLSQYLPQHVAQLVQQALASPSESSRSSQTERYSSVIASRTASAAPASPLFRYSVTCESTLRTPPPTPPTSQ